VVERRRLAEHVPVADLGEHPLPVGHVAQRGQGVVPEARPLHLGREPQHQRAHACQQHEQGGQQAPGPAGPEAAQPDPAEAVVLGDQQRRDQVAGEDEEQVDAEEAALQPVEVEDDHHGDRQAPQAVQRRLVAEASRPRPLHPAGSRSCGRRHHRCRSAPGRRARARIHTYVDGHPSPAPRSAAAPPSGYQS